jgi:hypothetical protein
MTRSSEVLIGSPILTRETRTRDAIKPSFRAGHFRCWPRLCENASEPRTLRIVFSIAYHQQHLPVRLVSATTKSRWKFYAQVQRLSFHTVWTHCGHGIGFGGCRLLTLNERRQLVSHTIVWPHPTGKAGYATAAIARSISGASVACAA